MSAALRVRSALDAGPSPPHSYPISRPDGRSGKDRKVAGEESPGSTDIRCRITSGGPIPSRGEASGTVPQRADRRGALRMVAARVKGCGKSAPRRRQRRRHGKPHREQDRIGTARSPRESGISGSVSGSGRPGRLLEAPGDRRPRGMAVARAVHCTPYRTRLTGRLIREGGPVAKPPGPRQFLRDDPILSAVSPRQTNGRDFVPAIASRLKCCVRSSAGPRRRSSCRRARA
jgi:hypothetical protein